RAEVVEILGERVITLRVLVGVFARPDRCADLITVFSSTVPESFRVEEEQDLQIGGTLSGAIAEFMQLTAVNFFQAVVIEFWLRLVHAQERPCGRKLSADQ